MFPLSTRQKLYQLVFTACVDNGGSISKDTELHIAAGLVGRDNAAQLIADMDATTYAELEDL